MICTALNPKSDFFQNYRTPDFLKNFPDYEIEFLAQDMSVRKYYRIKTKDKSFVLMDAPPPENPKLFWQISDYLQSFNLSSPKVFYEDIENGFLLLEDFGNNTFTKVLVQKPELESNLYKNAVSTLKFLQKQIITKPDFIEDYDNQKLLNEVCVFLDFYWCYDKGNLPSAEIIKEYKNIWNKVFSQIQNMPKTLVLRDFHVDNIMYLEQRDHPQKCGLLDFQDALWGPAIIDLVSLLEDARRDVHPDLKQNMWDFYMSDIDKCDHEYWKNCGDILSASRHAKILGVFTRYFIRNGSNKYLIHLPRLWILLGNCLENHLMVDLKKWFTNYFPEQMKMNKS
jgi:aminoglycoside/choline kinase family phosphotransferase